MEPKSKSLILQMTKKEITTKCSDAMIFLQWGLQRSMSQQSLSGIWTKLSLLRDSLRLSSQQFPSYSFLPTSSAPMHSASLEMERARFSRWRKGGWDPYNHGIGPISQEGSMIGGKPLPIHGDLEPNHSTPFDDSFRSLLESNFRHLFLKNIP